MSIKDFATMPNSQSGGSILIPTQKFFEAVLSIYKHIKAEIFKALKLKTNLGFITDDDVYPECLLEKVLDFEEFQKILLALYMNHQRS